MKPGKLTVSDGAEIHYYRWLPGGEIRGAVQIAHGMGEHAGRYDALAGRLNQEGYAVYANDHRGHGLTAGADRLGIFGRGGWDRVIQDAMMADVRIGRHKEFIEKAVILRETAGKRGID